MTDTESKFYTALFVASTILLCFICINASRQMLCISNMLNKEKFHRTIMVTIFAILSIILNTLLYTIAIYGSNFSLFMTTYLIEAGSIIFAFHISRVLGFAFVEQLFINAPETRPKWITYGLYTIEVFIAFSVFICYVLALFIFNNIIFIYVLYVIMNVTVLIMGISSYFIVQKLRNMLNGLVITMENESEIKSSIRAVNNLQIVIGIISIASLVNIFFEIESIEDVFDLGLDIILTQCILHSVFLMVCGSLFVLMVMERNKDCCYFHSNSLCFSCMLDYAWDNQEFVKKLMEME